MGNGKGKVTAILLTAAISVFILVYMGVSLTQNLGKTKAQVTAENVGKALEDIMQDISVHNVTPPKGQIDLSPVDAKNDLPDISKFPPTVTNTTADFVEIFTSTEKGGKGTNGWLNDVANDFNNASINIDGKVVSVMVRNIASGTGADYIASGKYVPDAFTPSNELWGEMLKAEGVKVQLVEKRMAGNVPGILLSKAKHDALIKKYGAVNIKTITDAVANNELAMGYTDPFASSTGLNFLISALNTFDSNDLLSDKAAQGFEKFQTNIPFVASTTLQMADSAKSGVLDGFILEYQIYINSPDIRSSYIFTPFGVRHDSPMYAIGDLSTEKIKTLNKFIEFSKQDKYQKLASADGFNNLNEYKPEIKAPDGDTIFKAQKLWKEKKNALKEICAVFVADVSGSMEGVPINKLKESLLKGSRYIGKDNMIGLVSYSNDVNINLPIAKFDINQQSLFAGAVGSLQASGSTATFDGVAVATKMIKEQMAKNPNLKPMIFVLSDGETNKGHSLNDIEGIIQAYKIPIYTIGYNANIKALQSISSINEAASINADTDDVVYKLGGLFNTQM